MFCTRSRSTKRPLGGKITSPGSTQHLIAHLAEAQRSKLCHDLVMNTMQGQAMQTQAQGGQL